MYKYKPLIHQIDFKEYINILNTTTLGAFMSSSSSALLGIRSHDAIDILPHLHLMRCYCRTYDCGSEIGSTST